jgi:hypothetical protein
MAKAEQKQQGDKPVRMKISNPTDVPAALRELGKLYKAARRGAGPTPTPGEAAQLARVIAEIRGLIETSIIQKQLKAGLENLDAIRNGKKVPPGRRAP